MNKDQAKGKVEQAVGNLTGDDDLAAKGKADERAGTVKAVVDEVAGKADEVIDAVKDVITKN